MPTEETYFIDAPGSAENYDAKLRPVDPEAEDPEEALDVTGLLVGVASEYDATKKTTVYTSNATGNDYALSAYAVTGSGNDTITGSKGNDWINTKAGNDVVFGTDGHDMISTELGNDIVVAGARVNKKTGKSVEITELSTDEQKVYAELSSVGSEIYAGKGEDTIYGSNGHDFIYGQDGNDVIRTGNGNDWVLSGAGNDIIDLKGTGNKEVFVYGEEAGFVDTILNAKSSDKIQFAAQFGAEDFRGYEFEDLTFNRVGDDLRILTADTGEALLPNGTVVLTDFFGSESSLDTIQVLEAGAVVNKSILNDAVINVTLEDDDSYLATAYTENITIAGTGVTVQGLGDDDVLNYVGKEFAQLAFRRIDNDLVVVNGENSEVRIIDAIAEPTDTLILTDDLAPKAISDITPSNIATIAIEEDWANLTFEREPDSDNGWDLVVRNNRTKETYTYEDYFMGGSYDYDGNLTTLDAVGEEYTPVAHAVVTEAVINVLNTDNFVGMAYNESVEVVYDAENAMSKDTFDGSVADAVTAEDITAVEATAVLAEVGDETPKSFISGGNGADILIGGNQMDVLMGGNGDDVIAGGNSGADVLYGGAGNDEIYAADMKERLNKTGVIMHGGEGSDYIIGGNGNDVITGDAGNDEIYGNAGDDSIDGGAGADEIYGGNGNDTILGGDGDDSIEGGAGNDSIVGGYGKDTISGGAGNDTISGGDGVDAISAGAGNDLIDGGDGGDLIEGGDGKDTISGGAGDDLIYGDAGNDEIYGDAGNDTIYGGNGNDEIFGGLGNDELYGGAGSNTFYFAELNEAANTVDTITDATSKDTLVFANNFNALTFTKEGNNLKIRSVNNIDANNYTKDVIITDYFTTADKNKVDKIYTADLAEGDAPHSILKEADIWLYPVEDPFEIVDGNGKCITSNFNEAIDASGYVSPNDKKGVTITAGTGKYVVEGSDFDDTITATKSKYLVAEETFGTNKITGGKGNDIVTINVGVSNNTINLGDGINTVTLNNVGVNKVTTGKDADTVTVGAYDSSNTINVGDGDNVVTINGVGKNKITAKNGNNTITLNNGENTVTLGYAEIGNDITINAGVNKVTSGAGFDELTINGGVNTVKLGNGESEVTIDVGAESLNDITTGKDDDTFTITGGTNAIKSGNGVDSFTINSGDNTIIAGNGGKNGLGEIVGNEFTIVDGTNIIKSGSGDDMFVIADGDNIISSGAGDDEFTVAGSDNILDGGAGVDTFIVIGGANLINGGAGNDIYNFANYAAGDDMTEIIDKSGTSRLILDGDKTDVFFHISNIKPMTGGGAKSWKLDNTILYGEDGDFEVSFEGKNIYSVNEVKIADEAGVISITKSQVDALAATVAGWLADAGYSSTAECIEDGHGDDLYAYFAAHSDLYYGQ